MKKVLFLMFLLFLIGLGAGSVKAQVRIGGNAAPNAAAVLDLNAANVGTGTKGLALPRVVLTSDTMQITPGVPNIAGMMVHNTSSILGEGIYFWLGVASAWVKASMPYTSAADSGKVLMSDGNSIKLVRLTTPSVGLQDSLTVASAPTTFLMRKVLDTVWTVSSSTGYGYARVNVPGISQTDLCFQSNITGYMMYSTRNNAILAMDIRMGAGLAAGSYGVRCYRPYQATVPGDSGKYLMSTGTDVTWSNTAGPNIPQLDTINSISTPQAITWQLVLDSTFNLNYARAQIPQIVFRPGLLQSTDMCLAVGAPRRLAIVGSLSLSLYITNLDGTGIGGGPNPIRIRCVRPSL